MLFCEWLREQLLQRRPVNLSQSPQEEGWLMCPWRQSLCSFQSRKRVVMAWVEWPRCPPESVQVMTAYSFPAWWWWFQPKESGSCENSSFIVKVTGKPKAGVFLLSTDSQALLWVLVLFVFFPLWKMLEECDSFRTVFCIDLGLSSGYYIKYYQPGGLNNRHLFLTVLEAGKSKIKVLADLESDHDPLPGLQMAAFLLYPPMIEREKEGALVSSSLYKDTNPITGGSPSWPHLSLMTF